MVNLRCKKRWHKQGETGNPAWLFRSNSLNQIKAYSYRRKCQAWFVNTKLTRGEYEEVEGHVRQRDYGQHAVVTIGLNEIVTGNGCGVNVVLSKRSYKGLQDRSDSPTEWKTRNCKCRKTFYWDYLEYKQWILVGEIGLKMTHGYVTFPKMGRSTDPHVSAPQWTNPDAKSAVSIPATENEFEQKSSTENWWENSQHLFNIRTSYHFSVNSYRCSTGCTTCVPDGSWQVGEWNWRPWERSRG